MLDERMVKWDRRFLKLAKEVSTWSKDPSTQVGAAITHGIKLVSVGFNGFPENIFDDDRLANRELKYDIIIHAEINALITAGHPVDRGTLYTYPFLPCSRCASIMIQAGIWRVVAPKNTVERWAENLELSKTLFFEAGVEYIEYENVEKALEDESESMEV